MCYPGATCQPIIGPSAMMMLRSRCNFLTILYIFSFCLSLGYVHLREIQDRTGKQATVVLLTFSKDVHYDRSRLFFTGPVTPSSVNFSLGLTQRRCQLVSDCGDISSANKAG